MLDKDWKKSIKKRMKSYLEQFDAKRHDQHIKGLLIHREVGEDYDSEKHLFLMAAESKEKALKELGRIYPVGGLELGFSAYDCTGRPFCDPADIKEVCENRYLVALEVRFDV